MEKTFELKSIKIDLFGVDCKYRTSETDDENLTVEQEYHVKVSRPIHPDLRKLFEEDLTAIAERILNVSDNPKIVPTGVSFAGKNDNIGLSIIGELQTAFGRVTFKTPRIKYKTGTSWVCAQLTVFADAIVSETNAYLFEGKTAEMEVFGE